MNAILVDAAGNTHTMHLRGFPPSWDVPLPVPVSVQWSNDEPKLEPLPVVRFQLSHVENGCAFYYFSKITTR
jgi:hypothetical protein